MSKNYCVKNVKMLYMQALFKSKKAEIIFGSIALVAILTTLAAMFLIPTSAKYASQIIMPNTVNLTVQNTSLQQNPNQPEAYVVYTDNAVTSNDGTQNLNANSLTFKYNDQSDEWAKKTGCTVYAINEGTDEPKWVSDQSTNITAVNIENSFNQCQPTTCSKWFYNLINCNNAPTGCENINTSACTNMNYMFASFGSNRLADDVPNVSDWNTSNVTDMSNMFYGYGSDLGSLTKVPDISKWNTSNVTNISNMFNSYGFYSTSLANVPDVSNWDTTNVTDMSNIFSSYGYYDSTLNSVPNVSGWNTSKVNNMSSMFSNYGNKSTSLASLPNMSNWNTSNVNNMSSMFSNYGQSSSANFKLNLINFDFSKVTNINSMLSGMSRLITINCNQDLSNRTDLSSDSMFSGCTNLKGGAGTGYDSGIVDKTYARPDGGTSSPGYFTAPVAYAVYAPNEVSNNGDLTLASNSLTFFYDTNKQTWIDTGCTCYDMNEDTNEPGWLSNNSSVNTIKIDSSFAYYKPTTCYKWFYNFSNCNSAPFCCENINTSACTNMSNMFYQYGYNNTNLLDIPNVSNWDTSNVTDMSYIFASYGYKSLGLSSVPNVANWNTAQVTNMTGMFYGYGQSSESAFTLNLSGFDFGKITTTDFMFMNMTGLVKILCNTDLSNRNDLSSVDMFAGCLNLAGGKGTLYDSTKVDKAYACPNSIDQSGGTPGYFTAVDVVTLTGDNTKWTQYSSDTPITKAYIADSSTGGETLYIKPTVERGFTLNSVQISYDGGTSWATLVPESEGTYAGYYKISFSSSNLNMLIRANILKS